MADDSGADQPRCSNCEAYKARHADDAAYQRAAAAGHVVAPGYCWRFPTAVPRHPDESCEEHSARRRDQLILLAREIAKQLKVR